jgi:hypothetical protein
VRRNNSPDMSPSLECHGEGRRKNETARENPAPFFSEELSLSIYV